MKKAKAVFRVRLFLIVVAIAWVLLELFWFAPPWGSFGADYDYTTSTLVVSGWFKQSLTRVSFCSGIPHINWYHVMARGLEGEYRSLDSGLLPFFPLIRRYRRVFLLYEGVDEVSITLGAGSGDCVTFPANVWDIPVP